MIDQPTVPDTQQAEGNRENGYMLIVVDIDPAIGVSLLLESVIFFSLP